MRNKREPHRPPKRLPPHITRPTAYAANSPVNFVDPSGTNIFDDIIDTVKKGGEALVEEVKKLKGAAEARPHPLARLDDAVVRIAC